MDNIVTINNIDYTIDIKPADHYNIILDSHNPEGQKGDTGNGISSIEKTSTSGLVDTYTITFTDGNETTFDVTNGSSIDTIEKTSTVGLVDTYTITLTNGDTSTFTVTNGKDGTDGTDGQDGADATINGVNALTLTANYGLTLTQSGSTANISGKEITDVVDGISAVIPAEASESNKLADKAYVGSQIGNGTITINQGGSPKGTFTTNQSGNTTINLDAGGGGGGGAVDSVNGQTGTVVLTASDVGALPDSTVIPDAQIQSDWTQADNTKVDYIKNKPTIPTDTSDLTNGAGYISGITSTDVTNALGYTPYSSANPDGYTSNVGTVTSVNNVNPVSGNVTLSIPTVNNATLTINQGGTFKGTFGANASSDVIINLDAGGGSSLNVGAVITSSIPQTDAGLHLLDGGVLQRGSYADFVDYMADLYNSEQTVSDINIIGTLTDNSGIISGFSADNFALLPFDKSLTSANSWEFVIGFNVDNWQTGQVLLGYKQFGSGRYKSPQVYLHNQYIELSLSSNGTSWDIADDVYSTYTLSANTDYLMKLKFTGSAYIVEISSDNGTNWTTYTTVNSSTKCYGLVGTSLGCGGGGGAMLPYTGTIDLTKTYFNIDGSRIWNGVMPKDFCSEDAWQASITAYGVCDKYVYDSVNNTVRLPKWGNQLITGGTVPAKGNGIAIGLTNGTDNSGLSHYPSSYAFLNNYGATYGASVNTTVGDYSTVYGVLGLTTDETKSGIISDLSKATQAMDVYYYVVIANSVKTEIEVDIDEIATDLNGKVSIADCATIYPVIAEYVNGTEGYRIWSSGYCEQWGLVEANLGTSGTIAFLKEFAGTNYNAMGVGMDTSAYIATVQKPVSTTQIEWYKANAGMKLTWRACGYLKAGEY